MLTTGTATLTSFDMSNDEYHAERQHISRSTAYRYRGVFGGRAQQYEDGGRKIFGGNSSTDFGSVFDAAVGLAATGGDWRSAVVSPPANVLAADGSRRGKAYTEWRSANVCAGALECSPADYQKVEDMLDALYGHRNARRILEDTMTSQMSVFWRDEYGHDRKARGDGVTHGNIAGHRRTPVDDHVVVGGGAGAVHQTERDQVGVVTPAEPEGGGPTSGISHRFPIGRHELGKASHGALGGGHARGGGNRCQQ
jgi:hypothetical protein